MDEKPTEEQSTLVERWLRDQQEWQKTALAYLDSMVKNDDFLVHLGNAMRGSLLAGKPYPSAGPAAAPAPETPDDSRLDEILHALRKIEGQLQDVRMDLDELRAAHQAGSASAASTVSAQYGAGQPAAESAAASATDAPSS